MCTIVSKKYSGTEANEAAIKLARLYGGPGKYKIITALNSFHGRTFASLSATGQPKYHQGLEPMLPGFCHVPFGNLEATRLAIDSETCAVMVEPIQGEGGVNLPPNGYLEGLRKLCDDHDLMLIFDNQSEIEVIKPNFQIIEKLKARGLIVTAKGNDCDFVSRFFAPQCGINEDPVTGSAHTTLVTYWSNKLNKTDFLAEQISRRKGKLKCKKVDDRVQITGKAVLFMKGEMYI